MAILQDVEIGKLHEGVARLATKADTLKETKRSQLQPELREVKDFVNRLQFGQTDRGKRADVDNLRRWIQVDQAS